MAVSSIERYVEDRLIYPSRHAIYLGCWSGLHWSGLAGVYTVSCRLRKALLGLQQALQQQPLQTSVKLLSVTAILGLLVNKFTMVHPYLVADNRYSAINLAASS